MQHSKNADSDKMIKNSTFQTYFPQLKLSYSEMRETFPVNLLIVARYDYSQSQNVCINALKAVV